MEKISWRYLKTSEEVLQMVHEKDAIQISSGEGRKTGLVIYSEVKAC